MTVQSKNNNLNYLIDPTFTNVNGLFVLPFARTVSGDKRDSFLHYFLPTENRIKVLTSSLESSLCDCSDAYILVTGNITITGAQLTQMQKLHLKIAHHSKNAEQK